jgi:hypothetical protein
MMRILDLESGEEFDVPGDTNSLDVPDDPPLVGNRLVLNATGGAYNAVGCRVSKDPTLKPEAIAHRRLGGICMVQDPQQTDNGGAVYWRSKVLSK